MGGVWKIGRLAKQTGLTVRTLRYYDQIGLLSPSGRTDSGYRLYSETDVARLHQIISLRALGFPLDTIKELLDRKAYSIQDIVALHLNRVREHIALQQQLCERLELIAQALRQRNNVSADELIRMIEVISMVKQHGFDPQFTPEELEKIKQQGEKYGPDKIKQVEQEWPELIEKVRAAMKSGTPPADPDVQQLMARWRVLVSMFTGGDPEISRKLKDAYERAPDFSASMGMDAELMNYVNEAMACASDSKAGNGG